MEYMDERIAELERQRDQDAVRIHELSDALAAEVENSHRLQLAVAALEEQLEQALSVLPSFLR